MRWFLATCLAVDCEGEQPFRDVDERRAWSIQHVATTGHVVTTKTRYLVEARLRLSPRFLATRRAAERMRGVAVGLLCGGEGVALDFGNVEVVTIGFADELVGKLIEGLGGATHDDRPRVCLMRVNSDVRYALETALKRRGYAIPPSADPTQLVAPPGREIHDIVLTP